MATSQNGFTANDRRLIETFTIPGTDRKVSLRKGAPGELLVTWAAWFDKHIESVDGGILDDWGYAERTIRGSTTQLSNHASGTALDLNAPRHPLGRRGTFSTGKTAAIRKELKRYEGAIRWGGDYKNRADEMHFEINASPDQVARVLAKIEREDAMPEGNHVEQGHALIRQGIAELRKAPKDRTAVHHEADGHEALVKEAPEK